MPAEAIGCAFLWRAGEVIQRRQGRGRGREGEGEGEEGDADRDKDGVCTFLHACVFAGVASANLTDCVCVRLCVRLCGGVGSILVRAARQEPLHIFVLILQGNNLHLHHFNQHR